MTEQEKARVWQFIVMWVTVIAKFIGVVGSVALAIAAVWIFSILPLHIGWWLEQGLTPLNSHQSSLWEISWYWGVGTLIYWVVGVSGLYSAEKTWGESDDEE